MILFQFIFLPLNVLGHRHWKWKRYRPTSPLTFCLMWPLCTCCVRWHNEKWLFDHTASLSSRTLLMTSEYQLKLKNQYFTGPHVQIIALVSTKNQRTQDAVWGILHTRISQHQQQRHLLCCNSNAFKPYVMHDITHFLTAWYPSNVGVGVGPSAAIVEFHQALFLAHKCLKSCNTYTL